MTFKERIAKIIRQEQFNTCYNDHVEEDIAYMIKVLAMELYSLRRYLKKIKSESLCLTVDHAIEEEPTEEDQLIEAGQHQESENLEDAHVLKFAKC